MKHKRRQFLGLAAGSVASATVLAATGQLTQTPRQTAGPFYPNELPLDQDNDLIQIEGHEEQARGISCNLYGRVLDRNGQAISDAKIEIWQCDANGRYHHPDDTNPAAINEHFQGYGSTVSDAEGRYRFRTIQPVPYPGRTPHIHFRVTTPAGDQLTTQMYIAGHSGNRRDGLYQRLGNDERKSALSAVFVDNPDDSARLKAEWDIVIG